MYTLANSNEIGDYKITARCINSNYALISVKDGVYKIRNTPKDPSDPTDSNDPGKQTPGDPIDPPENAPNGPKPPADPDDPDDNPGPGQATI